MPINTNTSEKELKRTHGILLDEKQWMYMKNKYMFSAREVQVAILLCRGFRNEQIAESLNIKQGTVKTHLRNLYRRCHVNNKIALVLAIVDEAIDKFYVPKEPVSNTIPSEDSLSKTGSDSGG